MERTATILIVDDEPINLDFFEVMLSNLGFQVEKAENGEEALEKVRSCEPDLIILDNIMPRLTGWEVTKILRRDEEFEKYRTVPIIMFSAMDDIKDKVEGFELGVEDYITKPFNFSEVLARIKAVLRGRELSHQLVRRERRLMLFDSLNTSLKYFTAHLKQPVVDLIDGANNLDTSKLSDVDNFVGLVVKECEQTLAALKALEEEIEELHGQGQRMKEEDLDLNDLDEKFKKHFQGLHAKSNARTLKEVKI